MVQLLWKTVWWFLKKFKIALIHDPAVIEVALGFYTKETQIQKDICCPVFTAALSTITKIWKQLKHPSIDE